MTTFSHGFVDLGLGFGDLGFWVLCLGFEVCGFGFSVWLVASELIYESKFLIIPF